jgi:hypothetical protein
LPGSGKPARQGSRLPTQPDSGIRLPDPFQIAQDERCAERVGEPTNLLVDCRKQRLPGCLRDRSIRLASGGPLLALFPPNCRSLHFRRHLDCDPMQPAADRGPAVNGTGRADEGEECGLERILGVGGIWQ